MAYSDVSPFFRPQSLDALLARSVTYVSGRTLCTYRSARLWGPVNTPEPLSFSDASRDRLRNLENFFDDRAARALSRVGMATVGVIGELQAVVRRPVGEPSDDLVEQIRDGPEPVGIDLVRNAGRIVL